MDVMKDGWDVMQPMVSLVEEGLLSMDFWDVF